MLTRMTTFQHPNRRSVAVAPFVARGRVACLPLCFSGEGGKPELFRGNMQQWQVYLHLREIADTDLERGGIHKRHPEYQERLITGIVRSIVGVDAELEQIPRDSFAGIVIDFLQDSSTDQ